MSYSVLIKMLSLLSFLFSSKPQAEQPGHGPGSAHYSHQEVHFQDFADEADGYWLFEPRAPRPDSAHVIVFSHGYGAYNPMIYGRWIRHLVQKGNIVIYPRYQKNLISPSPDKFADNVAKAIRDAIQELQNGDHVKPILDDLILVGHSYGGVVSADLAVNFTSYGIPQPAGVMLCAPGTGFLNGGRLDSYEGMPADLKLVIVAAGDDHVVGDEFAKLVFETAIHTPKRNLIYHFEDESEDRKIRAKHNECYALDKTFDSGSRNITALRSFRWNRLDEVDYYCYWKLLDALIDCTRAGKNCEYVFGNTPEQRYMGEWSEEKPVKPLEVVLPE